MTHGGVLVGLVVYAASHGAGAWRRAFVRFLPASYRLSRGRDGFAGLRPRAGRRVTKGVGDVGKPRAPARWALALEAGIS